MAVSDQFIVRIVKRVVGWKYIVGIAPWPVKGLLKDPRGFIRETFLNILLVAIGNVVFTTTDLISAAINALISPFTTVRVSLTNVLYNPDTEAIDSLGEVVVDPVVIVNEIISSAIANALGFGGFPILVALYVAEIALLIRVGRAAIPALSDASGAIPVIGSVVDGIVTFGYRLLGGSS